MTPSETTVGEAPASLHWEGDELDRKPTGDFLYKLLVQRFEAYHSAPDSGALCIAIDADWGFGKTFFAKRWSEDITNLQHPVIWFDAWVNDLSDDPLLGFMSQLRSDLQPLVSQIPLARRADFRDRFKDVFSQAGRAVLPMAGVLAKGLIKKAISVEIEELADAAIGSASTDERGEGSSASDAAIDAFFDRAMESHKERRAAIQALRRSIEELLRSLDKQESIRLPMFVFVDELDRCRPNYAIGLLEGMKHLFDARGVCFVFSTNLSQLSASVLAIYGNRFDGGRYLKRFFDIEYLLPQPDHVAFARFLTKDSILAKKYVVISGLPPTHVQAEPAVTLADNFAVMSQAFGLDLRSQKQVFRNAEAAASGLMERQPIYCFFLFFLTALLHWDSKIFDGCASESDQNQVLELLKPLRDHTIQYTNTDLEKLSHGKIRATEVFSRYLKTSWMSLNAIRKEEGNIYTYPESIHTAVAHEAHNRSFARDELSSLAQYVKLVRAAGQLR